MPKVSEFFNLWLKPHHLPENGGASVTIERVTVEELHPRPGQTQQGVVLSFVGKARRLILNGGNANRLANLAGDEMEGWVGVEIRLKRADWYGRATIVIEGAEGGG